MAGFCGYHNVLQVVSREGAYRNKRRQTSCLPAISPPNTGQHTFHPAVTPTLSSGYGDPALEAKQYSDRDKRMHTDERLDKRYLRNTDLRQTLVVDW